MKTTIEINGFNNTVSIKIEELDLNNISELSKLPEIVRENFRQHLIINKTNQQMEEELMRRFDTGTLRR